jgi:hypothetical protein
MAHARREGGGIRHVEADVKGRLQEVVQLGFVNV